MSETVNLPYFTREELLEANAEAVKNEYSSYCWQSNLEQALKDENKHPVTAALLDSDGNMVCRILIGPEDVIYVALTAARFNNLPTVPVDMVVVTAMAEAAESPKH